MRLRFLLPISTWVRSSCSHFQGLSILLLSLPNLRLRFLCTRLPRYCPLCSRKSASLRRLVCRSGLLRDLSMPLRLPRLPVLLLRSRRPIRSRRVLLPFLCPSGSRSCPLLRSSGSLTTIPVSIFRIILPRSFQRVSLPLPCLIARGSLLRYAFL